MVVTQDCYQLVIINQLLTIIIIIIDVMRMLSRACVDLFVHGIFFSLSKSCLIGT